MEAVADFGQGETLVAEQTADFQGRVARNPVVGGEAAHLLRHFGEVFRRDAELVGIIGNLAVIEECAVFQKGEEAVHDVVVLCGDLLAAAVKLHVEVEEVDDHALDGVNHGLAVEVMAGEGMPPLDVVEVEHAHLLLLGVEAHDGVDEQRQMSLRAIIALRCADLDELLRNIHHINHEIKALHYILHQVAPRKDEAVARLEAERLVVEGEGAVSISTKGMCQVAGIPLVGDVGQGAFDDDVGALSHGCKDW